MRMDKEKEPHKNEVPQEICLGIKEYETHTRGGTNLNTMTVTIYVNTTEGIRAYEEVLKRINQFVIG